MDASLQPIRELITILETVGRDAAGTRPTPECGYLLYTSSWMKELAAGYIALRTSGHRCASKVLVRPLIEATFNAVAAFRDKSFLLNKAYTEYLEEKRMPSDTETQACLDAEFTSLTDECKRTYGTAAPQVLTVFQIARIAGLESMYNTAYRVYCKYSHGALRAQAGQFDQFTGDWDDRWVQNCLLAIALCLKEHTSFPIPDLVRLMPKEADVR